jgi:hypothetical protein
MTTAHLPGRLITGRSTVRGAGPTDPRYMPVRVRFGGGRRGRSRASGCVATRDLGTPEPLSRRPYRHRDGRRQITGVLLPYGGAGTPPATCTAPAPAVEKDRT